MTPVHEPRSILVASPTDIGVWFRIPSFSMVPLLLCLTLWLRLKPLPTTLVGAQIPLEDYFIPANVLVRVCVCVACVGPKDTRRS